MAVEVEYKELVRPIERVRIGSELSKGWTLERDEQDNVVMETPLGLITVIGPERLNDFIRAFEIIRDGHE